MNDLSAAPIAQGKDELNRSQSSIKTNDNQTAPKKKEVNFSEQREKESSSNLK